MEYKDAQLHQAVVELLVHARDTGEAVLVTAAIGAAVAKLKRRFPSVRVEGVPGSPPRSIADRLAELNDLRDRGVITDAEYATRRREIIASIGKP